MEKGLLYFVADEFYERFGDYGLLKNKEMINGKVHGRPCCYLFSFEDDPLYWMIPVSSKVEKYEREYNKSIKKYGMCDNISFGYILGEKRAFLPQNMFPVTEAYIQNVYIDTNKNEPIQLPTKLMKELNQKARKKIRYNRDGKKFGMSDIVAIYDELSKDLTSQNDNSETTEQPQEQ